jgi:hypothetical protein
MTVARLGYEIDSSGAVKAAGDLDDMSAAAKRAEVAANKVGAASKQAGGYVRGAGAQTAYFTSQLNDIGMMMAAGQNPLQLALQRGSQVSEGFQRMGLSGRDAVKMLASSFTSMINPMSLMTLGVIAGTAALTQWAFSAAGAEDDARSLDDVLGDLASTIKDYREASLTGADATEYVRKQFGMVNEETIRLGERMQELRLREIMLDAADATRQLASEFSGGLRSELARIDDLLGRDWFDDEAEGAKALAEALNEVRMAKGPEEQLEKVRALSQEFLTATGGIDRMNGEQREFYQKLLDTEASLSNVVSLTNGAAGGLTNAANAARDLASAIAAAAGFSANLDSGIRVLEAEIGALERGADASIARTIESMKLRAEEQRQKQVAAGQDRIVADAQYAIDIAAIGRQEELLKRRKELQGRAGGGAGGGGGGASDAELTRLVQSLQTEREVLDSWYFEQQMALQMASDQELAIIGGKNEAKLRLEQEYQERLVAIKQQEAQHIISAQSAMYGELSSLLGMFGQKSKAAAAAAIAINTVLRVRETLQNTAAASVRALAELGPIAGPPAAAKIAAYGKAQAALIAAGGAIQAVGKLGGSGSGSSAGITATGAQQTQQTRAIISLKGGRSRFTVEELDDIVQQIQDKSDDGVIIEGFSRA